MIIVLYVRIEPIALPNLPNSFIYSSKHRSFQMPMWTSSKESKLPGSATTANSIISTTRETETKQGFARYWFGYWVVFFIYNMMNSIGIAGAALLGAMLAHR